MSVQVACDVLLWVCSSMLGGAISLSLESSRRRRQLRDIELAAMDLREARLRFFAELARVAPAFVEDAKARGDYALVERWRRLGIPVDGAPN